MGIGLDGIVAGLLTVYGCFYLATALFSPAWFQDHLSVERREGTWLIRAPLVILTFGSCVALLYAALKPIVAIIPWTYEHPDLWRFVVSATPGIVLAVRIDKVADALVRLPLERQGRAVLMSVIQRESLDRPGMKALARYDVANGMERLDWEKDGSAVDFRDEIKKDMLKYLCE